MEVFVLLATVIAFELAVLCGLAGYFVIIVIGDAKRQAMAMAQHHRGPFNGAQHMFEVPEELAAALREKAGVKPPEEAEEVVARGGQYL